MALMKLAKGDMRKVVNILQATSMAFPVVDEHAVYMCTGNPLPEDLRQILEWLLNSSFDDALNDIQAMKTAKGIALQDILHDLISYVSGLDLPNHVRIYLFEKLSDLEYRLASGTNERMQLAGLVGVFAVVREMSVKPGAV
jgi:replication factor C subunit 3/5